jgi:DNA-directed RNA polymerase specialized sigma24 family protein
MTYNYTKELKKFTEWKENEERLLRKLNVDEDIITNLHDYDVKAFNKERSYKSKQRATRDVFFLNIPVENKKEVTTVTDLLDEIENEALFSYLSKTDQVTLNIILLKMLGYSVQETSHILDVDVKSIYNRTQRLKKKIKFNE